MNVFKRIGTLAALAAAASLLAGCGAVGPGKYAARMMDWMGDLPKEMQHTNYVYIVKEAEDEGFDQYQWDAGFREGEESFQFRKVTIQAMNYGERNMAWVTGALVPDHLPKLKKGDVIEVRMRQPRDGALGFTGEQDAPIVINLICPFAGRLESEDRDKIDARFKPYYECASKLPARHPYDRDTRLGPSDTPYLNHWKDYGFTVTKRYTVDGEPLPGVAPRLSHEAYVDSRYGPYRGDISEEEADAHVQAMIEKYAYIRERWEKEQEEKAK